MPATPRSTSSEDDWAVRQEIDPINWTVQLVSGRLSALKDDGSQPVAWCDRAEFVRKSEEAWVAQFESQLSALRDGFFSTFPELATRLLTWRELERRVCGLPDVSVDALKRIVKYEGSYEQDAAKEYLGWFWEVVSGFTGSERKSLLGFCWGRGRLPSRPTQPFTIDSSGGRDDSQLPRSHTCMFQLHFCSHVSNKL